MTARERAGEIVAWCVRLKPMNPGAYQRDLMSKIEAACKAHAEAMQLRAATYLDHEAEELEGVGSASVMRERDNLRAHARAIRNMPVE